MQNGGGVYTHPCQYVSVKVGTQWYPQGNVCESPYGDGGIQAGHPDADCIYGEHWLRDAVNQSPTKTTYHCP